MPNLKPTKKRNNQLSIVPVGNEEIGFFYFQKLGYLKTGEVLEISKYESNKKRGNVLISSLINKIAKDKGIDNVEAAKYIFPSKMADGTEAYPPDQEAVLAQYPEELQELGKFKIPTLEIHNFVANLFLSGFYTEDGLFVPGRVAFQSELLEDITINDDFISLEETAFTLSDGDAIKFNDVLIRIDGNHDVDSTIIKIKDSPGNIKAGATGFLFDVQKKQYILGNESWTMADTIQLPEEMIEAIYSFYQSEAGLLDKESVPESQESGGTERVGENLELIGQTSIGESKDTESLTLDSVAGQIISVNQLG